MRGQRGAGHVEFIISFVLFIVVVGIFLIFVNPIEDESIFKTSLNSISENILENVSSTVEIYGVKMNENNKVIAIGLGSNSLESDKVLVKNLEGELLDSEKVSDNVYVLVSSDEFIFISVGVGGNSVGVSEFPEVDQSFYQIGSVRKERIILENNLLKISNDFSSDYESLKGDLNIPEGLDFSFLVDLGDGEIIEGKKSAPLRLNVYSDVFRKEVIRIDGQNIFVDFGVSIW